MDDAAWGRREVWIVFAVALAARFLHLLASLQNPLLHTPILDEAYYAGLGRGIASGFLMGEGRAFFMDPLYGYFLGALLAAAGDDLLFVRAAQIVLDSVSAALVYLIGARLAGKTAGLAAGLIYAFYKVSFFYSLTILKTTLTMTALLLFVHLLVRASENASLKRWLLLGLLGGLAVELRANTALLMTMVPAMYWIARRPRMGAFVGACVMFAAGVMAPLMAGAARNFAAAGEFAMLPTQGGRLLYSCNNPDNLTGRYNTPPFSRPNPEDSETDFHAEAEKRLGKKLTQRQVSDYWTNETLSFLASTPSVILRLAANKLKAAGGDYEIPDIHSFYQAAEFSWVLRLPLPTFAFLLALGIPGLAAGFWRDRRVVYAIGPPLAIACSIVIFYASSRMRMEAVPFLAIGAGIFVKQAAEWLKGRDYARMASVCAVALALFAASKSVAPSPPSGAEEFYLAKGYLALNDLAGAKAAAQAGAEKFPAQSRFASLLGSVALAANQPDEAIAQNMKALQIEPGSADAYHNMGLAYLMKGDAVKAAPLIKKGLDMDPRPVRAFALARAHEISGDKKTAAFYYMETIRLSRHGGSLMAQAKEKIAALGAADGG
ncbi:MAG: glycosyltransferase family 39 protein [Nitrospinae bacterium]|nr:glycosyltransferase family 39 protein [Nitrospinota bacterium]